MAVAEGGRCCPELPPRDRAPPLTLGSFWAVHCHDGRTLTLGSGNPSPHASKARDSALTESWASSFVRSTAGAPAREKAGALAVRWPPLPPTRAWKLPTATTFPRPDAADAAARRKAGPPQASDGECCWAIMV